MATAIENKINNAVDQSIKQGNFQTIKFSSNQERIDASFALRLACMIYGCTAFYDEKSDGTFTIFASK